MLKRKVFEDRESWLAGRGASIGASEAAAVIGRVAKENGMSTEKIETSVAKMQEIARTAQICPEDLTRGGNRCGKR